MGSSISYYLSRENFTQNNKQSDILFSNINFDINKLSKYNISKQKLAEDIGYVTNIVKSYLDEYFHEYFEKYFKSLQGTKLLSLYFNNSDSNLIRGNGNGNHEKIFKLNIYIDPSVDESVKKKYKDKATEHNLVVDTYLNAVASEKKEDINMEDFCFDSGFDLFCPSEITSYGSQSVMIDHKINCSMKLYDPLIGIEKYVGYYLYSRSSTPLKTPLRLANSVGVIDSGYRGNIKAIFDNIKGYDFMEYELEIGDRFVQLCPPNLEYPMKIYIVDNIDSLGVNTVRGDGGFGSTG
tara:strand:+ start:1536 stop:2417 length:882 start_codon:yes stop_codon:yes gene_type:complete